MSERRLERLANDEYLPLSTFRIFRQTIHAEAEIHWHEFFEMVFITAGEGTHLVNGTSYPLKRGGLFLLTPADFHALVPAPDGAVELFNVIFSEAMVMEEVYQLLFTELDDCHVFVAEDEYVAVELEFRRLWAEAMEQRAGRELMIHWTLQRLLVDFARRRLAARGSRQRVAGQHDNIQRALIYVHHHYREGLSLTSVAQQVGLSPNYFSECFHAATGVTFQTYTRELRLRFAMSLMSVSSLPVTDICYAAGFQTLSHFERAFKARFGQSPTATRARLECSGQRELSPAP